MSDQFRISLPGSFSPVDLGPDDAALPDQIRALLEPLISDGLHLLAAEGDADETLLNVVLVSFRTIDSEADLVSYLESSPATRSEVTIDGRASIRLVALNEPQPDDTTAPSGAAEYVVPGDGLVASITVMSPMSLDLDYADAIASTFGFLEDDIDLTVG